MYTATGASIPQSTAPSRHEPAVAVGFKSCFADWVRFGSHSANSVLKSQVPAVVKTNANFLFFMRINSMPKCKKFLLVTIQSPHLLSEIQKQTITSIYTWFWLLYLMLRSLKMVTDTFTHTFWPWHGKCAAVLGAPKRTLSMELLLHVHSSFESPWSP